MDPNKIKKDPTGGHTDKKEENAGGATFNQGSEQDPNYNDGTPVSDTEKRTGHLPIIDEETGKQEGTSQQ